MAIEETVREKISSLVHDNPVVLFMKGNRQFPQCGFSAQVIGVLNDLLTSYQTVNVLADPNVRDGVKEYSGWPTIPQLYIGGEFVGGCDIVKEMHANGELRRALEARGVALKPSAQAPKAGGAPAPKLTVTPAAAAAFADSIEPGEGVYLSIGPGYRYDLSVGAARPGDVEVRVGSLTFYIDPESAARADGTTIDFVDEGEAGFKLTNPNEPARVKQLSAPELKAMLDAGTPLELFDVRTPQEREIARLDRARLFDEGAHADARALPKDATIVFHCHHGGRSQAAADRFAAEGFRNVYNLKGGIDAWSTAVDPAVRRY